jgi:DNA-directed RNA polymerase subunit RPC12/RpoP
MGMKSLLGSKFCRHEIDREGIPSWDSKVGRVYRCVRCGAEIFKVVYWNPLPGEKLHLSKKERRKRRKGLEGSN